MYLDYKTIANHSIFNDFDTETPINYLMILRTTAG
jgi:hypothetical protein